jgi:membrane protease YdiL (CAAX protease family)
MSDELGRCDPDPKPLNEASPSSERIESRPWGFWATLGFSAIIFALFCALQFLVAIAFVSLAKIRHPELDLTVYAKSVSSNGFCIAIMTLVTGLICIPLTLLFAKLRRNISVKNYIGFRMPSKGEWIKWLLTLAAFIFLSDMVSLLLHYPIALPFMVEAYKTAFFLPALFFSIIVVAPLFEEIFFRGFLFEGIRHSRLGPMGAIGITSLFWAVIHLQYDIYGITTVFALGLLFGIVRVKTDSIYLLMAMHSLTSFVATMETVLYVRFTG